ncbi:hypothetical protein [Pedobacter agri]|uniref:hypothetical protein n=1 Tax=Pedobacter agri TaxID=454586 RepID=UPI00292D49EF|nr:hypothetical protein [Pedobacter agri]
MRSILIIALFVLVVSACKKKNEDGFVYHFNIKNNSGVSVFAINTVTLKRYRIDQGESNIIFSNEKIDNFKIEPSSSTPLRFLLEHSDGENYSIHGYEYDLEYKFSGKAAEADGSYLNDSGQEVLFFRTKLPFTISYKHFKEKRFNISATSIQENSGITVEVLYRGKLIRQVSSPKNAGASGNINGGTF